MWQTTFQMRCNFHSVRWVLVMIPCKHMQYHLRLWFWSLFGSRVPHKTDVKIKRGVAQLMPGLNMDDILDEDMAFKRNSRFTSSPFTLGWMWTPERQFHNDHMILYLWYVSRRSYRWSNERIRSNVHGLSGRGSVHDLYVIIILSGPRGGTKFDSGDIQLNLRKIQSGLILRDF